MFDEAVTFMWESLAEGGVSNTNFWQSHKRVLQLLGDDPGAWTRVFAANLNINVCGKDIIKICNQTVVGKAMFKAELVKCARLQYTAKIIAALDDVAHENFGAVSMQGFQDAMSREGAILVRSGDHRAIERVIAKINFHGSEMAINIECINDEWQWRLNSMLKSHALNTQQVEPLIWETWCFPPRGVPGARETGVIPEEAMAAIVSARDAAGDYISDISADVTPTLAEVTKHILGRARFLKSLDRSFEMDLHFLQNHAPQIIAERAHAEILAVLPTSTASRTFKEVLWKRCHSNTISIFPDEFFFKRDSF